MGFVDRINDAVLRRLRRSTEGRDDSAALANMIERIERLEAVRHDDYIGDTLMLVAALPDDHVLQAREGDAGWDGLLRALDASGRTSLSSTEWRLRLIADEQSGPMTLIGPANKECA